MRMNVKEKFRGSLLGYAIGDALAKSLTTGEKLGSIGDGKYTDETQQAICVCESLKKKSSDELFSAELNKNIIKWYGSQGISELNRSPDESILYGAELLFQGTQSSLNIDCPTVAARACPIGLFYYDNIPQAINYARLSCLATHDDFPTQAASVAASLMVLYGVMDVPVGLWGEELLSFASGIDNELVDMIKTSTEYASKYVLPDKVVNSFGEGSRQAVVLALYSSMLTKNFKDSMSFALRMQGPMCIPIAAITGACSGARFGLAGIPDEWKNSIEDKDEIIQLADKIFDEKHLIPV